MFLFAGSLYKITNVEATSKNWYGYIRDLNTNEVIEDVLCTIKFGYNTYPPTYVFGNSDITGANGYYSIVDDLPDNWGATFLKCEVSGYVTKTTEIPANINYLGGSFTVYLRPYF